MKLNNIILLHFIVDGIEYKYFCTLKIYLRDTFYHQRHIPMYLCFSLIKNTLGYYKLLEVKVK